MSTPEVPTVSLKELRQSDYSRGYVDGLKTALHTVDELRTDSTDPHTQEWCQMIGVAFAQICEKVETDIIPGESEKFRLDTFDDAIKCMETFRGYLDDIKDRVLAAFREGKIGPLVAVELLAPFDDSTDD